jgi:putative two-component system response regulator
MIKEKQQILIVDDQEMNRSLLSDMLEENYRILEATNGIDALEIMRAQSMDIACVLLDVRMPKMDGFEVLKHMKAERLLDLMPVIIISNDDSMEAVENSYSLGANDYINRPFNNYIVQKRVENTIFLYRKTKNLMELVAEQVEEKEKSNANMITALSAIVEFRNGESGNHVLQIRIITEILLEHIMMRYPEYDLDYSAIANISNAASLHDIGKITIPSEILNKPGRLTKEEFEIMKTHSAMGSEMLDNMKGLVDSNVIFDYAWQICRWHHERWDGKGYPDQLVGEEIPMCAQVVAVADVYDALTSKRVYKPAYSHEKAMEMILGGECGAFNPKLLEVLKEVGDKLPEAIARKSNHQDKLFDIQEISNEILVKKDGLSERTINLVEEERTKYQFLADLSNEIIIDYDVDDDTLTFSEKGVTELNLPLEINRFKQNFSVIHVLQERELRRLFEKVRHTTPIHPIVREQLELLMPDGSTVWYEIILRSMWSREIVPKIKGVIGKLLDINDQKMEMLRLENLAARDTLTNLYNRNTAQQMIEAYLSKQKGALTAAYVFLDVDNFKKLNDSNGHVYGDKVLSKYAEVISNNIRSNDVAARVGGDEFIIFLKDISNEVVVHRQIERLYQAFKDIGHNQDCSISMGVALYPNDAADYKTLSEYADQALYHAKNKGKNQYCFYQEKENK